MSSLAKQSTAPKRFALLFVVSLFTANLVHAEETAVAEKPVAKKEESAAKSVEPQVLELAGGKLLLPVPGDWKVVKPRSRIVHHEFSIAAAKGDDTPGRVTIMPSGGGIKANIARWEGQFKSLSDDAKKIEEKKIGDLTVHVVDLTGDYQDSPRGPFGPKVDRPGYRMLAAIVPLKEGGTWFIKSYGPKATMKAAEKGFAVMIEGVKLAN